MPKSGNNFLDETPEKADKADKTYYMSMMIEILGQQQGKDITYSIHCPKLTGPGRELIELFGTSLVNVVLPVVIGAKMAIDGAEPGVIFAEQLDAEKFLDRFKATGVPYEWTEKHF